MLPGCPNDLYIPILPSIVLPKSLLFLERVVEIVEVSDVCFDPLCFEPALQIQESELLNLVNHIHFPDGV